MQFSSELNTIVYKLLTNGSFSNITPLRLRLYNGSTDITSTIVGVSYVSVPSTAFNDVVNGTVSSAGAVDLGLILESYTGTIKLSFQTNSDVPLFEHEYDVTLSMGFSYRIRFTLAIPNLSVPLATWLLNYTCKNVLTGTPTSWYLEFVDKQDNPVLDRYSLTSEDFSKPYVNEAGIYCVSISKYYEIPVSTLTNLAKFKLYSVGTGGAAWFTLNSPYPTTIRSQEQIIIANNAVVFTLLPVSPSFTLLPSQSTNVLAIDMDGRVEELNTDTSPTLNTVAYKTASKLFNSEYAEFSSQDVLSYPGLNIPNDFTINVFIRFKGASPNTRAVDILTKTSSFRLYKSTTHLVFSIGASDIISAAWSPVVDVWYHVYVSKTSSSISLKVNSDIDTTESIASTSVPQNTNPLAISSVSNPILGDIHGVYVNSGTLAYSLFTQPIANKVYIWKYLANSVWTKLTTEQWTQYFK